MSKDTIYQNPMDSIADFSFDEKVVSVFPDMIQRSVPGYSTIIAMTGILASKYATPNSHIYDLGCSLGASLFSIIENIDSDKNISVYGIDNSISMIEKCKERTKKYPHINLACKNIQDTNINNASVVVLNFSLQFIPIEERSSVINKIYQGMNDNSILILSEKIKFNDDQLDELNIDLHHQFKKTNGYSDLEISQKRNALEDILLPETLDDHRERIRKAGFQRCDIWFQCFNFASLVAIK